MDIQEFGRQLAEHRHTSPASQDAELEDAGIGLLARLETQLENLARAKGRKDQHAALESGKELLVEILEFLTEQFGQASVAHLLPRICELRDMVRDLQRIVSRTNWKNLLRFTTSHNEFRQQAYRQVGLEFAGVYRDLLAEVDSRFRAPQKVSDWRSGCRVFIEEFRRRW